MKVKRTVIQWHLEEYSREAYRRAVLEKWADEACGTGKDELAQRYRYEVKSKSCCKFTLSNPSQLTN